MHMHNGRIGYLDTYIRKRKLFGMWLHLLVIAPGFTYCQLSLP